MKLRTFVIWFWSCMAIGAMFTIWAAFGVVANVYAIGAEHKTPTWKYAMWALLYSVLTVLWARTLRADWTAYQAELRRLRASWITDVRVG